MAKQLVFKLDRDYPVSINKIDRKRLYGWKDIVAFDSNGEECIRADIDESGSFIIPKGGRALGTLDSKGNWVDKKNLTAVFPDGTPAPFFQSSFDAPIVLEKTVSIDEFLDHSIDTVYMLECGEVADNLIHQLKQTDRIYTFLFNYYAGYDPSHAFLIESKGNLFILAGYPCSFEFIGLDQPADADATEEEEEVSDELDFGMM